MRRKRSLALSLLVLVVLSGCASQQQKPVAQSPQRVTGSEPPPDPAVISPVVTRGEFCFLRFRNADWFLCNIHYHRPAEHGRPVNVGREVIPPCGASDGDPSDWVEIHYAYVRPPITGTCPALQARALRTNLGRDCPSPYIVRSVWAKVTDSGTFDPKTDPLPDSARYVEYDGSSTGGTGGTSPAWWKINRDCLEVTTEALRDVHLDPTRELQRPTTLTSTKDR